MSRWLAEKLLAHSEVADVTSCVGNILKIKRKKYGETTVGVLGQREVSRQHVRSLFRENSSVEFVVNIPRDSFWNGDAIKFVSDRNASFGSVGDLFSALNENEVRFHVNKEFGFVEQGLLQHSKVVSLERLYDRLYTVNRVDGLRSLDVLLNNEYDLTAEHVRSARARYGKFDLVLVTNPNGRATSSAQQAASSMDAEILKWGELLSRLRR